MTKAPNLFLALDYVRTYSDLASMESTNETAKHAAPRRAPARAYDKTRWEHGLPHGG